MRILYFVKRKECSGLLEKVRTDKNCLEGSRHIKPAVILSSCTLWCVSCRRHYFESGRFLIIFHQSCYRSNNIVVKSWKSPIPPSSLLVRVSKIRTMIFPNLTTAWVKLGIKFFPTESPWIINKLSAYFYFIPLAFRKFTFYTRRYRKEDDSACYVV